MQKDTSVKVKQIFGFHNSSYTGRSYKITAARQRELELHEFTTSIAAVVALENALEHAFSVFRLIRGVF